MSTQELTIRLDGELTIYQVGERASELQLAHQQFSSGQSSLEQPLFTIDTRELIDVDSAGLQLLVHFAQCAREADITLDWQTPSAALTHMINLYNAAQWFNAPSEATS